MRTEQHRGVSACCKCLSDENLQRMHGEPISTNPLMLSWCCYTCCCFLLELCPNIWRKAVSEDIYGPFLVFWLLSNFEKLQAFLCLILSFSVITEMSLYIYIYTYVWSSQDFYYSLQSSFIFLEEREKYQVFYLFEDRSSAGNTAANCCFTTVDFSTMPVL